MHHSIHRTMSVGLLIIALALSVPVVVAQDDCATFTQTAWETTAEVCGDLAANTICYGHGAVDATLSDSAAIFAAGGDRVPVESVAALQLAPLNLTAGIWGIAYAVLGADRGTIEVILMGNVTVEELTPGGLTFTGGTSADAACPGPVDGVLVTATAESTFTLNGAAFDFASDARAFFALDADGALVLYVLTGEITDLGTGEPVAMAESSELGLADLWLPAPESAVGDAAGDPETLTGIFDPASLLDYVRTQVETHDPTLAAGGTVNPLSGTWESTPITFVFEGCSESEESTLRDVMGEPSSMEITFGEVFDHRAYIEEVSLSEPPPEMVFSNPALNFYNTVLPTERVLIYTDMHLVSPTEWYGIYSFDRAPSGDSCRMAVSSVFVRISD